MLVIGPHGKTHIQPWRHTVEGKVLINLRTVHIQAQKQTNELTLTRAASLREFEGYLNSCQSSFTLFRVCEKVS